MRCIIVKTVCAVPFLGLFYERRMLQSQLYTDEKHDFSNILGGKLDELIREEMDQRSLCLSDGDSGILRHRIRRHGGDGRRNDRRTG